MQGVNPYIRSIGLSQEQECPIILGNKCRPGFSSIFNGFWRLIDLLTEIERRRSLIALPYLLHQLPKGIPEH